MTDQNGSAISKLRGKLTAPFAIFVYKKLAFVIAAGFIALTLLFVLTNAMPNTPADTMMNRIISGTGQNPFDDPGIGAGDIAEERYRELYERYEELFGVGQPYHIRYLNMWERILTLDFGVSASFHNREISRLISRRLPFTMALVLPALPVGFVIGNWIGSKAAYYGGKIDNLLYYLSNYLNRAPLFWVAIILVMILASWAGIFPGGDAFDLDQFTRPTMSFEFFLNSVRHWILPFMVLTLLPIGGWAVGMRAMTLYEKESDYMQYARQLGFSSEKLRKMAERNAILPNFTGLPLLLNTLIGNTLIIEIVLGYQGIGSLFYEAAHAADWPLMEAAFLITLVIVLLGNFLADIIYGILDPRIGTGYVEEE